MNGRVAWLSKAGVGVCVCVCISRVRNVLVANTVCCAPEAVRGPHGGAL